MKKIKITTLTLFLFLLPLISFAQSSALDKLEKTGVTNGPFQQSSDPQTFLYETIGELISIFSALLAVIFIVLMLLAGFHYMTAQGDEGKVKQSLDTIKHAVIGLIIVVSSYAITMFILNRLSS